MTEPVIEIVPVSRPEEFSGDPELPGWMQTVVDEVRKVEQMSDELVAGRELDAKVEEAVFNNPVRQASECCDRCWVRVDGEQIANYSTGDADAMRVVEKLKADDFWPSMNWKSGIVPGDINRAVWFVRFRCVRGGTRGDHWAYDESLPLAICKAAREVSKALAGGVAAPAAT